MNIKQKQTLIQIKKEQKELNQKHDINFTITEKKNGKVLVLITIYQFYDISRKHQMFITIHKNGEYSWSRA